MPQLKSLADRQADQAKAREKQAERARRYAIKPVGGKQPPTMRREVPPPPSPPPTPARPQRPWAQVRAGNARLTYQSRTANETVAEQPWAKELVSTVLAAADQGGVTLCLVWPAKVTALPLLHALANVERVFARDLRGVRTLLYPGTHACRAPLHSVLANRETLSAFYRTLWVQQPNGAFEAQSCTSSPAFLGALWALNDLTQHTPGAPNPSLAELVPTFVFDPSKRAWATTTSNPLERKHKDVQPYKSARERWLKLSSCPFCGNKDGSLLALRRHSGMGANAMGHYCTATKEKCSWNARFAKPTPLPFYIVDEDIYDLAPSVLLGTVDKLAAIGQSQGTMVAPTSTTKPAAHRPT